MNQITIFFDKNIKIIFLFVFIGLLFFYNVNKTSFIRPQGLHQWRQSVGASYAMNYYNYNLNPIDSRIYNNISNNASSDIVFAEFPGFYYVVGVLYKIFGPHEYIFRIANLFILFLGLLYLLKSLRLLLKDNIWALLITILTFTSATLVYYSNSFLPDTTAFGISFIAFYHVIKYIEKRNIKYIYFASLLYTAGGLSKVSSLIPFFAFLGTYLLLYITNKNMRAQHPIYKFIIPMLLPIVSCFFWYLFVDIYHAKLGGTISAVEIRPIWNLDSETISKTWSKIFDWWLDTYYHRVILLFALIIFILNFFLHKVSGYFVTIFMTLATAGSVAFFLLFFRSLYNHDYYLINLFFVVIFSCSLGVYLIGYFIKNKKIEITIKIIFAGILLLLIMKTKDEVNYKLNGYNYWQNNYFFGLTDIEPLLNDKGIKKFDKVICMPDPSINISLNMINRPGYTDFGFINYKEAERIEYFKEHGAKYLLILDRNLYSQKKNDFLKPFLKKKILSYKNVDVYQIKP